MSWESTEDVGKMREICEKTEPLFRVIPRKSIKAEILVYRIIDQGAFYGQDNIINMSVIILIIGLALLGLLKCSHASQHAFALPLKV